ncbi:MAG: hypothetical protein HY817_02520 [Candidatus Abawacabacteria bacterium]|nr:hypothetical protein [Candidatus Abawacabacteria bacterium]
MANTLASISVHEYGEKLAPVIWGNISQEYRDEANNQINLPDSVRKELAALLHPWMRMADRDGIPGKKVPASYDAQVQGWTTQSRILRSQAGLELWAVYNYRAGRRRLQTDRLIEFLIGDEIANHGQMNGNNRW